MWIRRAVACIAFIALFFVLNALLIHAFRVLDKPRQMRCFASDFRRFPERYDMLIVGDSRALTPMHPELPFLRRARNASDLGDSYAVSYYKAARTIKQAHGAVRTIVITVGRDSFASGRANQSGSSWHAPSYDYVDLTLKRGEFRKHAREFLEFRVFPYRNWPAQFDRLTRHSPDASKQRFSEDPKRRMHVMRSSRLRFPSNAREDRWNEEAVYYFNRLARLCREHGIRLVAINFPVSQAYYDAMEDVFPAAEFENQLQSLLAPWPEVVYLDYERLFFGHDDWLSDAGHLNCYGAQVLAPHLERDMRAYGIELPEDESPVQGASEEHGLPAARPNEDET